jgi:hypothetical protein
MGDSARGCLCSWWHTPHSPLPIRHWPTDAVTVQGADIVVTRAPRHTHRSHHPPRPRRGAATALPPRPAHAPCSCEPTRAAGHPGGVTPPARRFSTARCSMRCSGRPQVTRPAAPLRDRAPGGRPAAWGAPWARRRRGACRRVPRGARPTAVSLPGHGARGPVAVPRPGGPPVSCHLARGARISWAGTVPTRVVREARASGPEAWTAAGAPRGQPGWDRRMQRRKECGSSG